MTGVAPLAPLAPVVRAPAPVPRPVPRARWIDGRAAGGKARRAHRALDVAVLDAQLRQGLVAVRQLGRAGRRVGAIECEPATRIPAFASRWDHAHAQVPCREKQPGELVDAILDLVADRSVRVLIPIHDGTIDALQQRRAELERECVVALAAPAALDAAIDKERTLRVASELELRIPRSIHVNGLDDVPGAAREIGFPVVVKPRQSWVSYNGEPHRIGPVAAVDLGECTTAVAALYELGAEVMLQEWIPGAREAVSFVYAHGRFHGEFAQVARRMVPILGGNSVARESIPLPPDAAGAARELVAALALEGYAEVEFRRDATGAPVLMEINPRLSASVEVAVRSGVDFPRMIYDWATGGPIARHDGYRPGVRMRWLGGDVRWLLDTVRFQSRPDAQPIPRAVWDFARDFARPAGYDYWAADDPWPAAVASYCGVRNATQLIAKKLQRGTGRT